MSSREERRRRTPRDVDQDEVKEYLEWRQERGKRGRKRRDDDRRRRRDRDDEAP